MTRKKEGVSGLKETQGGARRDDRHVSGNSVFDPITIDSKNAQTAIYMLQSPEANVVLKAVAGLEAFGRKSRENLIILSSLKILQYLTPLLLDENNLIKRFAQKLTGMLCSLNEYRDQILEIPNILELVLGVLEKETDLVMQEFSALILAQLTSYYVASAALLKVENCVEVLFERITSSDPDVKKNCLDVMNHLLIDVNGIEAFIESPGFKMKNLLELTTSSYPVIQNLALEVLKQLTSWCRDARVLFAFKDSAGFDYILNILEREEWADLHLQALQLLINVLKSPKLSDYLLQGGYLERISKILDTIENKDIMARIFGVFARISQTPKGRAFLHMMDMETKFCDYLDDESEVVKESACVGIANMAFYGLCLDNILTKNPIPRLLAITTNMNYNPFLRTLAAYCLNVLCNNTHKAVEILLNTKYFYQFYNLLQSAANVPVEVLKNILQMFTAISLLSQSREKLCNEVFLGSIIGCIQSAEDVTLVDTSYQEDALECLAAYMVEMEAVNAFDNLGGAKLLFDLLKSKHASIREWAGHLIVLASQSKSFVKNFLLLKGLDRLMREKSTAFSMPSWQKAIDALLANHLPAKFAYTGRLDFQDITEDGFYVSSSSRYGFVLLESCLLDSISPICPFYVSHFTSKTFYDNESSIQSERTVTISERAYPTHIKSVLGNLIPPSSKKSVIPKDSVISSLPTERQSFLPIISTISTIPAMPTEETFTEEYGSMFFDSDLTDYLECLKKRLEKEELNFGNIEWNCIHPKIIKERARIIAEFVAEEMSGSYPSNYCRFYKEIQINQLKCQLGTNIIPLRFIRSGDYLERAMLFKVLADRVGFPCALVRGIQGRTWIEISIPVISIEDVENLSLKNYFSGTHSLSHSHTSKIGNESVLSSCESVSTLAMAEVCFWYPKIKMECFKAYPKYLLKPNAIVDLIEMPGRILRLNSPEADIYRGNSADAKQC